MISESYVAKSGYNDVLQKMLAGQKQNIDVESLQETTEVLSNPSIMKSLARSVDDLKKGRLHRLEQV